MNNFFTQLQSAGILFFKNLRYLLLLIFLPMVVIIAIASFSLSQFMNNETTAYASRALASYSTFTESLLSNYFMQTAMLSNDEHLQLFFMHKPETPVYHDYKHLAAQVKNVMLTNDVTDSIYLYSLSSGDIYTNRGLTSKADFYDPEAISAYEEHTWTKPNWFLYRTGIEDTPLITYYQLIGNPDAPSGVIIINFNFKTLAKQLKDLRGEYDTALFLMDSSGGFIASSFGDTGLFPEQDIAQLMLGEEAHVRNGEYIYYTSSLAYTNWNFVLTLPATISQYKLWEFLQPMLLLLMTAFTCILIATLYISLRLYSPIRSIMQTVMDAVPEYADLKKNRPEEEAFITKVITNTISQNKHMNKELEQSLKTLRQAQSIALQSQINPHFLYNTLDSISWTAVELTQSENEASLMIVKLAAMLRYSLDDVNTLVPFEKELEHARDYLELQQIRYTNRFEAAWDIHPASVQYPVIKILLQPLLENAIYHGIKPLPPGKMGLITIKTDFTEDAFLVIVSDNGVGMDAAAVEALNQGFNSKDIREKAHIGLQNVNQRIKLILGDSYGLEVKSTPGEGTRIICRLNLLT